MDSKKSLFQLPGHIHYLNGAYMSPLLTTVESAGLLGLQRKRDPSQIKPIDFFEGQIAIKSKFANLIHADANQVAIIPSVSYGLTSAIRNIPAHTGNHAIAVADDFPSDHYSISDWCAGNKKELKIIPAPDTRDHRGRIWNERILDAIQESTCAVVMSAIHWTDGTRFDLKQIGHRCREVNALFIVDGTQSVGALAMDVTEYQIDALVCAGYKWLLGPYSIGMAYYSERLNEGVPLENSWMNKSNSEDFTKLTNYTDSYRPGAARFNVGESSNFILVPMLAEALDQIIEWRPENIQSYSEKLISPLLRFLREYNFWTEEDVYRTNHLFGILLPETVNRDKLLQELQEKKIIVSLRGDAIRVSTHVYNTEEDIQALMSALKI